LGVHVGLGGDHADGPRLHPQRSQKLPHLGGLAHHPGDFGDLRRGFCHCRRRMLLPVGFTRGAVVGQFTLWTIMIEALQLFDPARHVRLEIARETRVGNPPQPQDLTIGNPWTPQVQGFHAHLHPRVGMLKPPIPQRGDVLFAQTTLDHRRAPRLSLHRKLIPRR
jgi:hypothetical protein